MARGPSGKLVVEIDVNLKRALHSRLARESRTMKEWLIEKANEYLAGHGPRPIGVVDAPRGAGESGGAQ